MNRKVLFVGIVVLVLVSSCAMAVELNEAPMLKIKVASGEMEPVEERMPVADDIKIQEVYEQIGEYGGEWRYLWRGMDDKWRMGNNTCEMLFNFSQDGTGLEPNVAKGYEVNEDSTEYIIYFREGMRWSDGHPFTADDVIFYWEHMLKKETFGKKLYDCYYSRDPETGEKAVAKVEKIDDYTVKVTHKYPSPLFIERVLIDNKWFFAPAHFYKTILPEFIGEEKALEKAKEYGFNDLSAFGKWTGYYYWIWPDRPTLRPWVAKNDPHSDRFIMERNPYYWKADAEGNQLPYIDRIIVDKMQSADHYLMEAISGNIDLMPFDFNDYITLKINTDKGDYRVIEWPRPMWSSNELHLNQTVKDPKLRELFRDVRFREALSVAVDRKEVAELVTDGLAKPQQSSVPKGLPYYQEGWADKWAEYDVERANQLLDEIGLKWDGNHEFRTFADGSKLTLTIFEQSGGEAAAGEFTSLLEKYFEEVGIRTNIKVIDPALYTEMKYNNELVSAYTSTAVVDLKLRPDTLVPLRVLTEWYGHYGLYTSTSGKEGVKPVGDVAKILEYWDKVVSAKNSNEASKWAEEIVKLHKKNQWILGFTGPSPQIFVVKNNFRNVPESLIHADEFRNIGHGEPEQFFIQQ